MVLDTCMLDLDLDISRSFDNLLQCTTGVNFEAICSLIAEI